MKKIGFLLLMLFCICLSSCANEKNHYAPNTVNKETEEDAVSAIKDVLQNDRQFVCGENEKLLYLQDYDSNNFLYLTDDAQLIYTERTESRGDYSFAEICIQDINSDGTPELLLRTDPAGDVFVFSYEDGMVYEFTFPFRGMLSLKQDGSFAGSGAASNYYIGRLLFDKSKCIFEELCIFDETDRSNHKYRINGNNASKSEAEAYINWFTEKDDALWTRFEENKGILTQ